ncbi:hypothetical protein BLSTO_03098 [Blastocystis sp. subtype 1]
MSRLEELIQNGIVPFVVFDGADLPNKQETNAERKESMARNNNLQMARQLEAQGRVTEACEYYYKAIDITPELYVPLIQQLREHQIDYVVAPYEADAELGFLYRNNYVDFVITEDSDSLVFGSRCVLFKLDGGVGEEIDMNRLSECTSLDFCGWTHDMFTYMCILCGCDYLKRLRGVGIIKAYNAVNLGRQPAEIFSQLRMKTAITPEYEEGFLKAVFTFRHQTVFDPKTKTTVPLMPYPPAIRNNPPGYLGPLLPPDVAEAVAMGVIHPSTHQPLLPFAEDIMEEESQEVHSSTSSVSGRTISAPEPVFSSPFISISFKALIEKPSQRGLPSEFDLTHIEEMTRNAASMKRINENGGEGSTVVPESPPRKRFAVQRVEESPVMNQHTDSFLDRFRSTGSSVSCSSGLNFSSLSFCTSAANTASADAVESMQLALIEITQ